MSEPSAPASFVVILGVNEIASAVALRLARRGGCVVMTRDPDTVTIRRRMAFHDALYGDAEPLEGVVASCVENGFELLHARADGPGVHVTRLGLLDVLAVARIDVLIDARMQKYRVTPDLRRLAGLTVGLGPGFSSAANCDVAIETRPGKVGLANPKSWTDTADGVASRLGETGGERFVYSPFAGRWRTALEIGVRVYRDLVIGHLDGAPLSAPRDGVLRGLARDGSEVPSGVKLIEIDPRARQAQWTGTDARGQAIAEATAHAIARQKAPTQRSLTIVS